MLFDTGEYDGTCFVDILQDTGHYKAIHAQLRLCLAFDRMFKLFRLPNLLSYALTDF
jgi:hypothetical protein